MDGRNESPTCYERAACVGVADPDAVGWEGCPVAVATVFVAAPLTAWPETEAVDGGGRVGEVGAEGGSGSESGSCALIGQGTLRMLKLNCGFQTQYKPQTWSVPPKTRLSPMGEAPAARGLQAVISC